LKADEKLVKAIEATLEKLLTLLEKNKGLLPDTGFDDNSSSDFHIHFCTGTPGVIPLMLEAINIFPRLRDRLMKAAIDAGTITWERGLIFKGNSLCHGIAGNGYLLHCIYRAFL
jgi:hypothetical protein